MVRIASFAWSCSRPLLFFYCIGFVFLVINKHMPTLLRVVEGYFKHLFEIIVWPLVDVCTESFTNSNTEDKVWDTGWQWHRDCIWNIVNVFRFFLCLLFLPLYFEPIIPRWIKQTIDVLWDFTRHVYGFLTLKILVYAYLLTYFAIKVLQGPLMNVFKKARSFFRTVKTTRVVPSDQQHPQVHTDEEEEDEISLVNNLGCFTSHHFNRRHSNWMCCMCSHYGDHSVMLPCGHTDLCLKCALSYHSMNLKCPFCGTNIHSCHRIIL